MSLPHAPPSAQAFHATLSKAATRRYVPLSERCFKQLGQPLPEHLGAEALIKSLPAELLETSWRDALRQLAATLSFVVVAVLMLTKLPWFLLPVGWSLLGLAASGLFMINRDCEHGAWTPSRLVDKVVGFVTQVSLLGLVDKKTLWTVAVPVCLAAALSQVIGVWVLLKYWVMPLVAFRLWRGTFRRLQNTVPDSTPVLKPGMKKDAKVEQQVLKPIRTALPAWLETVSQGINLYLPDQLSEYIPSYHLRRAYATLNEQYGAYLSEALLSVHTLSELLSRAPREPVRGAVVESPAVEELADKLAKAEAKLPPAPIEESTVYNYHEDVLPEEEQNMMYWIRRINWLHVVILAGTPALAYHGWSTTEGPFDRRTLAWAVIYYFFTGFGITAGYHRLWSHRSYSVTRPCEYALVLLASGSVQGSAKWWCRGHRAHHRYTDTRYDPYNAHGGFWYSHIGWMLVHPKRENYGKVDVHDIKANPVLDWQHRWYIPQALFMAFVLPAIVAGVLWGDWRGGFYIAGVMRLVFVHHSTFSVNSWSHLETVWGSHKPYDDERTPVDNWFVSFITLGEGNHNAHHEYPYHYANGLRWYDYDPTKVFILTLYYLGLAYDLQTFPENEIKKARLNMKQKKIEMLKAELDWPTPEDELPEMTWKDIKHQVKNDGRGLVVIEDIVHDVSDFVPRHPGGAGILKAALGTDATKNFHGLVYKHSSAARNLLSSYRVARLAKQD